MIRCLAHLFIFLYNRSMNNLIIITGDLAAGKSTLAHSLSEELRIPCLIKDTLKEIACDAIGYETREENRALSIAAVNSMIYVFNQTAEVGGDLILEANFRKEEISAIKDIADQYNYHAVLIKLTGDINLLYQRFLDRLSNRHIAHRSLNLDFSIERFASYIQDIRNEDVIYPSHMIDMSELDEDEVTEKALSFIYDELGSIR